MSSVIFITIFCWGDVNIMAWEFKAADQPSGGVALDFVAICSDHCTGSSLLEVSIQGRSISKVIVRPPRLV